MNNNSFLKFLGTGSAFNTKLGNTSAYIKENGILFLIDCGETVFCKIKELNLIEDVKEIYVAITHLHPDHVGSLGTLIFYCFLIKGIKPNIIYKEEELKTFLTQMGVNEEYYNFDYTSNINKIIFSNTKRLEVAYQLTNHVSNINAYSIIIFYINSDNTTFNPTTKIFYSGDSKCIDLKIDDYDYIYQDCSFAHYKGYAHLPYDVLCEKVKTIEHRKKIFLMHQEEIFNNNKAIEDGFNVVIVD